MGDFRFPTYHHVRRHHRFKKPVCSLLQSMQSEDEAGRVLAGGEGQRPHRTLI